METVIGKILNTIDGKINKKTSLKDLETYTKILTSIAYTLEEVNNVK